MTWWIICVSAALLIIISKSYFSNAISRLRQNLSRQQRETLELKGLLTDAREVHQNLLRQAKLRTADISRAKKRIADQQVEIRRYESAKAQEDEA
ncbi:MAG: hypothetical protein O7G87_14975 [bacterium]|nr:hypothetical protein [bacterium]